jgi:DNA-binding transcriptional LysR family regulator
MPLPSPSTRVVVIPLRDPPIARTMAIAWDRRRTLPPAAQLFCRRMVEQVTQPFARSAAV